MIKIILMAKRDPAMGRIEFFDYLAHRHAPLVRSVPEFCHFLQRYVQNHTRLPEEGADFATTFRRATERDSVIELWFDDGESLRRGLSLPRYMEVIRPDEARFNDLATLLLVATREVGQLPAQDVSTPFKVFDVLRRRADLDRTTFLERWQSHLALLASRPAYRRLARKVVLNGVMPDEDNPFGVPAEVDGIMETWTGSFEDAGQLAALMSSDQEVAASLAGLVDAETCMSLLALEHPVQLELRA